MNRDKKAKAGKQSRANLGTATEQMGGWPSVPTPTVKALLTPAETARYFYAMFTPSVPFRSEDEYRRVESIVKDAREVSFADVAGLAMIAARTLDALCLKQDQGYRLKGDGAKHGLVDAVWYVMKCESWRGPDARTKAEKAVAVALRKRLIEKVGNGLCRLTDVGWGLIHDEAPVRNKPAETEVASTIVGVALIDAAIIMNDGDVVSARATVTRWQKCRTPKPTTIGIDPLHRQRKLYRVSDVIEFIGKCGDTMPPGFKEALRAKAKIPRPAKPFAPPTK